MLFMLLAGESGDGTTFLKLTFLGVFHADFVPLKYMLCMPALPPSSFGVKHATPPYRTRPDVHD